MWGTLSKPFSRTRVGCGSEPRLHVPSVPDRVATSVRQVSRTAVRSPVGASDSRARPDNPAEPSASRSRTVHSTEPDPEAGFTSTTGGLDGVTVSDTQGEVMSNRIHSLCPTAL